MDGWAAKFFAFVFALHIALSCRAEDPARFFAVTNWYATFSRTLNETGSSESTDSDGCVISTHWSFNHSTTVSFQLMPDPQFIGNPFIRNYIWKQDDSFNVAIDDNFTQTRTCTSPDGTTFVTHDQRTAKDAGLAPATTNVSVVVNSLGDNYQIDVTELTIPLDTLAGPSFVRWAPVHELVDGLPATGLVLQGSTNFPMSEWYSEISPAAVAMDPSLLTADLKLEWSLSPTVEELEVVVKSADYKKWIPEGSLQDQISAGNVVGFTAVLQTKDGAVPVVSRATQFKFELLNVSEEPGVCLNYPNESPSHEPDLKFEADENTDLIIADLGAGAATKEGEYLQAEVGVSSFDFGAFGELKVTAVVNGKPIVGYWELDPEKKAQPLLLPRRQPNSSIADQWKEDNEVTDLADNDDNENEPVGDGHKGDGLSLYEEYRGFSEGDHHLRADPKRKDLFICNAIQSDISLAGISIFTNASGLNAHSQLQPKDLHQSGGKIDSWINFNYGDDVPHIVDQHGVIMLLGSSSGDSHSLGIDGGTPVASGPIFMSPDTATDDGKAAKGDWIDQIFAMASVAHEIAHVCAVWHHGDGDKEGLQWTSEFVSQPDGTPTFVVEENGKEITEKKEDGTLLNPPILYDNVWLGIPGGQHSGDSICFMRYACAVGYQSISNPKDRYVVREIRGRELCTSNKGTGINVSTNSPQSRYGDAKRGDCMHQICVNDKFNKDPAHSR